MKQTYLIRNAALALLVMLGFGCMEKFVEPLDPFVIQRLEKDPAVINFGSGPSAMKIKTNHANIIEYPDGLRIKGSLFYEHERYGNIRMTNGDFVLLKDSAVKKYGDMYPDESYGPLKISKNRYTRVQGDTVAGFSGFAAYGLFETPAHGILNKIKLPITPAGGMLEFGTGKSFKEQDAEYFMPLNDDQFYFVITISQGMTFSIGEADAATGDALDEAKTGVNIGQGGTVRFAFDYTDPFFFFRGDLTNIDVCGASTGGFAFSVSNKISYAPRVDIYDPIKSFDDGGFYVIADIPLPVPPKVNPLLDDAEAVVRFDPGDFLSPIAFFDNTGPKFKMGGNGKFTLNPDIVEGFISLTIQLAESSVYMDYKAPDDFQLSWIGVVDPGEFPDPKQFLIDRLKDYSDKMGFSGALSFLDYVTMVPAPIGPPPASGALKNYSKFFGTISSTPGDWELGQSNGTVMSFPMIGEFASAEATFEWSLSHIRFQQTVDVGGFAGVDLLGEFEWTSADFKLLGHAYTDIEGDWDVVGFKLAMELLADLYKEGSLFGFHGLIYLEGKFWADLSILGKITVGAKFNAEILIESDGTFKFCFEIGIGPVGFDVCIDYSKKKNGMMVETITMQEIPIQSVPEDMRFQPDEGPVQLPPDYVPDYETVRVIKRIVDGDQLILKK